MRTTAVLAAAVAGALGCARDLSLPPPPTVTEGAISGRVVYALPASQDKAPAAGARVELLGTGRITYADSEGRFVLDGIDFTPDPEEQPPLLVQFDPSATGVPSRQRLVDLGAFAPKAGLQLSIGDVSVSENARLRGTIVRADSPTPGGHSGTVVYVPQGPFTTFTNDDGSFELRDLPEGEISVAAFRTGYESVVVDSLALRAGEDFQLRELLLGPLTGGGTGDAGRIRGTVSYDTPPAGGEATAVSAVDGAGVSRAVTAGPDGTFLIEDVPPGVYQLTAVRLGYQAAIVPNVAVAPAGDVTVAGLRLVAEDGAGACVAGVVCRPPGAEGLCRIGTTSCTGGTSCAQLRNAIDGTACGAGAVCRAGACVAVCDAGRICKPANRCHVGVTVCSTGGAATCEDLGSDLPDGYACDAGMTCLGGECVECTGDGCGACSVQCDPVNRCHVGARSCSAGEAGTCVDTGLLRADGTGCGTNTVCHAGSCVPCAAGASCTTQTSNPCKLGFLSCGTGVPICVEGANKPDGTACGPGDACRAGACLPAGGQVQTLVPGPGGSASVRNPVVAPNGDVYWVDYYNHTVKRLPAGGTVPEVVAGKPGQAAASVDNQPATAATLYYPWALALDAGAGLLYVSDGYNHRIRAIQLTGNRWIVGVAGGGSAAAPGYGDGGPAASAELSRPEALALGAEGGRRYLYFRDDGHSRFRRIDLDQGRIEAWDVPSSCAAPVAVSSCGGQNSCSLAPAGTGGVFVSGYLCGTAIGTATYGVVRVPPGGAAPVHVLGRSPGITTEGGAARATAVTESPGLAVDAVGSLYYGVFGSAAIPNVVRRITPTGVVRTVAGTGAAASGGDGGTALQASFDGPVSLAFDSGPPAAGVDAVIAETRSNGLRRVLGLGSTVFQRGSLTGTTGASQAAVVGRAPAEFVGARLLDAAGAAMPGFEVTARPTSTPPGQLLQTTALTDVNGLASFGLRVGLLPGVYTFEAEYRDLYGAHVPGSPATFSVTATEPAAGTLMTVVNEERQTAGHGQPGFGPLARLYYPSGVVAGPDGTIYVAGYYSHRVLALSPEGYLRVIAGTGGAGSGGDGGLALDAQLYYPYGVALDDEGRTLYVADSYNHRVRAVDLATGVIGTLAGTGTSGGTGNGGPANLAQLAGPLTLAQRGGKLYVGEANQGIRVIDLGATPPTIDVAVPTSTGCAGEITFHACNGSYGCGLAVDAAGALYFSGYACGSGTGGSASYAIMKLAGGAITHVAGRYVTGSDDTDGALASRSYYQMVPALALGPGDRLVVSDTYGHRLRWIDLAGAAPVNHSWFGTGVYGYAGDYVNVAAEPFAVQLYYPLGVAFTPAGHAVVADYYNHAIRLVWKAAGVFP